MALSNTACSNLDQQWMARALQLAERGRYTTKPNPNVGCIIIATDGRLVGEGWHQQAGEAHAEVNALSMAGKEARGGCAYVTLEPCHHQGRTGPCTQALIEAGIARVVYAMQDPNPLVSGKGLAALLAAGIKVAGPLLEEQAKKLNPGFIRYMESGRPWLRCKLAMSLDGRTAMASGESKWITHAAARQDVQRWRAMSGAIITGIDSVLADNSRLNLRRGDLQLPPYVDTDKALALSPLRVILDTHLRIPANAAVLEPGAQTLIVTSQLAYEQQAEKVSTLRTCGAHVDVVPVTLNVNGRIDLHAVLALLVDRACYDVLVEAGATLAGAFVAVGLVDELIIYQASVLLGSSARPLLDLSIAKMQDKQQLTIIDQRLLGNDQRIIARFISS